LTACFLWIPLAVALMLSLTVCFYMWRFYRHHRSVLFSRKTPDFSLILRFGGMTGIIMATAIFFALIMAPSHPRKALIRIGVFWHGVFLAMLQCLVLTKSISCLDPAGDLHSHSSTRRPCLDRMDLPHPGSQPSSKREPCITTSG